MYGTPLIVVPCIQNQDLELDIFQEKVNAIYKHVFQLKN